jgi:hypothetical protein
MIVSLERTLWNDVVNPGTTEFMQEEDKRLLSSYRTLHELLVTAAQIVASPQATDQEKQQVSSIASSEAEWLKEVTVRATGGPSPASRTYALRQERIKSMTPDERWVDNVTFVAARLRDRAEQVETDRVRAAARYARWQEENARFATLSIDELRRQGTRLGFPSAQTDSRDSLLAALAIATSPEHETIYLNQLNDVDLANDARLKGVIIDPSWSRRRIIEEIQKANQRILYPS